MARALAAGSRLAGALMKDNHANKAAHECRNALCIIGATMNLSELDLWNLGTRTEKLLDRSIELASAAPLTEAFQSLSMSR